MGELMRENLQEELSQVIGLAKSLYVAAHQAGNRSEALLTRIDALLRKLDGLEGRVAATVKAEIRSQFSEAATEAANTIVQRQEDVSTAAEKAITAYDTAVRHSARRIFLTWIGAGVVGIAMMAAFALYTVNRWAEWIGYPPTVVPVVACQGEGGKPMQCVRISASGERLNCTIPKDGVAMCVPARN